jgi:hypothetical protein
LKNDGGGGGGGGDDLSVIMARQVKDLLAWF